MRQTPTALLIEHKLDSDLSAYVAALTAEGLSWRRIAARLTAETGVRVSYESLRTWFADAGRGAA